MTRKGTAMLLRRERKKTEMVKERELFRESLLLENTTKTKR